MTPKKPAPKESLKVAIYCRVSTYEQGKGDFSSLAGQENLVRSYCESKGWEIHDVYRDTKTGTTLERDELTRLLEDAAQHKFNIVAATKLDRMSRSVKDFLDLDEKLHQLGINLVITTQNIDTTTPAGTMQRTIMLAFAQFERDMIAERTREKLFYQAQQGFWGGGHAPLGYTVENKKLVKDKDEADLVEKIFRRYLLEPSSSKVASYLNNEGYRAKKRVTLSGKTTGGGDFNKQSIRDLLRNRIYIGLISYKGQQFKGLHEAIIDEELFNKVQQRLDASVIDRHATYENSPLLLLGLTKCGFCQNNLTTSFAKRAGTGQKYYYYKCTEATRKGVSKCASREIPAAELETFVQKLVIELGKDDAFFRAVRTQIDENSSIEAIDLAGRKRQLTQNLTTVKKEIANLVSALTHDASSTKSPALTDALKKKEEQQQALDGEIRRTDQQLVRAKERTISQADLKSIYSDFESHYSSAPHEMKRRLLQLLVVEIKSFLKRKDKTGEISIHLRGDGILKKEWSKIKEGLKNPGRNDKTGGGSKKVNPENPVSSFRGLWLREQDSNHYDAFYSRYTEGIPHFDCPPIA